MKLKIKLLSDTNITTGESRGGNIDSDIYTDDIGLPYIPARRIKGVLRDTAVFIDKLIGRIGMDPIDIDYLFGVSGKEQSSLKISNALVENYEENAEYLNYCLSERDNNNDPLISVESIIEYFTVTRISTAIDETGTAKDKSLRNIRVLHKDLVFVSEIEIPDNLLNIFTIIVESVRYMGSNKTRGFGLVECWLETKNKRIDSKSIRRELFA